MTTSDITLLAKKIFIGIVIVVVPLSIFIAGLLLIQHFL